MDLVDWSKNRFLEIEGELKELAVEIGLENITVIPVSATEGDNITNPSDRMSWYQGPTLLSYLENVDTKDGNSEKCDGENTFVMPVQRVCRPNASFRGFEGQVEKGSVSVGDEVTVLPSGEKASVKDIIVGGEQSHRAFSGMPLTLTLDKEIDVSRGCVLEKNSGLGTANLFQADIICLLFNRGKHFIIQFIGAAVSARSFGQIFYGLMMKS